MVQIISILLGGAVGAGLRFFTIQWVNVLLGRGFPYGTLLVNVLGSFLIGVLVVYFSQRELLTSPLARGLIVGVLGAFTTFSTFSLDNYELLVQGELLKMALNMLLSVGLCLLAVWLGVLVARSF